MDSTQRMDYLYEEYTRLNEKVEEYIKHTYEDFKFLGVIGAVVILWKPIPDLKLRLPDHLQYISVDFARRLTMKASGGK